MKKKIKVPAFIIYMAGIMIISCSVSFLIKADFGISVISSLPYTIYEITNILSIGMFVTIIQILFLITEIIMLKKATISMLLTFLSAFLMGLFIDISNIIFAVDVVYELLVIRLIVMVVGVIMLGVGAALLVYSKYPPVPDLIFTRDIAKANGWSVGRVKQFIDLGFFITSISLSLIFLGSISSIGVTTVLCVIFVGKTMNVVTKIYEKSFKPYYFFGEEKFMAFLELNIFRKQSIKQSTESK